jgi:large subunit ribosomal protein L23
MNQERLYQVVLAPVVSEKATNLADQNSQVVFKVAMDANKLEIKKAIEKLFKVKVNGVRVAKVKGKVKFNRFGLTRRNNWKKAYVQLAEGHDIDFASFG